MLSSKTYYTFYSFDVFNLLLTGTSQGLSHLSFLNNTSKKNELSSQRDAIRLQMQTNDSEENHDFFKEACQQLDEYFEGKRQVFSLRLDIKGTTFQEQVWKALQSIPYGTTQSYLDIANAINNPKAVRAVGRANGLNSIPIIIPCHRVIGASGKLTGYAYGVDLKARLLTLEGAPFINE